MQETRIASYYRQNPEAHNRCIYHNPHWTTPTTTMALAIYRGKTAAGTRNKIAPTDHNQTSSFNSCSVAGKVLLYCEEIDNQAK